MTAMANGEVQMTGFTSQALFNVLQDPSATAASLPNTTSDQATEIAKLLPPT
jgi:hypothetical protein